MHEQQTETVEQLSRVIVLGATNRIDLIDPSILRPGRFGVHIAVGLPDLEARRDILRIRLRTAKTADGAVPCTPKTCTALGYNCGQASDGCGGTIGPCGTCTAPQYCGAIAQDLCGGNNGTGADGGPIVICTTQSCSAQGATCGNLGDGCGGTTGVCGTCSNPQFCGGSGANKCGGNNGLGLDGGILVTCTPRTCVSPWSTK